MPVAARELTIPVPLPAGVVHVSALWEPATDNAADATGRPTGVVVIAHGAGAGFRHPFLTGFSAGLREHGLATLRFAFPYAQAGRRMPGPAEHALLAWSAAMAVARRRARGAPVWAAGKSYGGRMASMAAADGRIVPAGLVYLGYPLHAPGRADQPRAAHLPSVTQPQLFLSGTRDPFVDPREQLEAAVASCRHADLTWIEGGDHSFAVKGRRRAPQAIGAELAASVSAWLTAIGGASATVDVSAR
jgi:predicted alpha/beta-hydrolase family hydrolase